MRIAFVIQDLFSQGAQYATALMVRGFVAKGYDVDLVLSQVHKELTAQGKKPFAIPAQVQLVYLPDRKARKNVLALRAYLKRTDARAVVSMSPNYTWCLRLASLFLMRHPKLVHVEHGLAGLSYGVVLKTPSPFSKAGLTHRFLYSAFDRVLTVSSAGRDDFLRYFPFYSPERVMVVYNPVVDEVFYRKKSAAARHPWLQEKICPTYVSAGAYQEYKGHMDLLEALRLLKGNLNFRIVVFGQGPLKPEYDAFVRQNGLEKMIDFAGYTDNFPAEAKAADGFILPSRRESFGIVLVEALACGCPMLSTDAPFGPCEILKDGQYGRLVPVRNPQALAEGIKDLVAGKIARAPDESWNRFTLDAAVERYEKGIGLK